MFDTTIGITFDVNMPESVEEGLVGYPIDEAFDKYEINSDFLYNTWDLLWSSLIVLLIILLLGALLRMVKKRSNRSKVLLEKMVKAAKWNIPIALLYGCSADIFFLGPLYFHAIHLGSFLSIFSLFTALILFGYSIWLLISTFRIVWGLKKARDNNSEEGESLDQYKFQKKWEKYPVLYLYIKDKSLVKSAYMAFSILRGFIIGFTISCLYQYPMVQVCIIMTCNSLMFAYSVVLRPLKNIWNLIQALVNEALLLVMSISILILEIMDSKNITNSSSREKLGEAILFAIQAFNAFAVASMCFYVVIGFIYICKKYRQYQKRGIDSFCTFLQVWTFDELPPETPLQEEVNPNDETTPIEDPVQALKRRKKIYKPSRKDPVFASQQDFTTSVTHLADIPKHKFRHRKQDSSNFAHHPNMVDVESTISKETSSMSNYAPLKSSLFKPEDSQSYKNQEFELSPPGNLNEYTELRGMEDSRSQGDSLLIRPQTEISMIKSPSVKSADDDEDQLYKSPNSVKSVAEEDDYGNQSLYRSTSVKSEDHQLFKSPSVRSDETNSLNMTIKTFELERQSQGGSNSLHESRVIIDSQDIKSENQVENSEKKMSRQNSLIKTFKRLRNKKSGANKPSSQESRPISRGDDYLENDPDMTSVVLPDDPVLKNGNSLIKDFRDFKEKQSRLKENQKKNWYDNLRKVKQQIGKDKNQTFHYNDQ